MVLIKKTAGFVIDYIVIRNKIFFQYKIIVVHHAGKMFLVRNRIPELGFTSLIEHGCESKTTNFAPFDENNFYFNSST